MKRMRTIICCLILALCMLFVSCTDATQPAAQTTETKAPQTTVSVTAADPVDVPDTEVLTTEADSASAEEDTSSVPSVPYTLEHHVTDLSADLPERLKSEEGTYADDGGLSYRNTFLKDGSLYVYGETGEKYFEIPKLYKYTNGRLDEENSIVVPRVNDVIPHVAYPLRNGNLFVICGQRYHPEDKTSSQYDSLMVIDTDGTILSQHLMAGYFPNDWEFGQWLTYVIHEEDNGDVKILLSVNDKVLCFLYDADAGTITTGKPVYAKGNYQYMHVSDMIYYGNDQWLPLYNASEAGLLDFKQGVFKRFPMMVPEDKSHMSVIADANGSLYLFDKIGMYQYRENLPAARVVEWASCGVFPDLSFRNLWMIDEQHFYIDVTKTFKGKAEHTLYYVETEFVLDETPKQEIVLDYYGFSEWIDDAILTFNRNSDEYEIRYNNIIPDGMNADEIRAAIDDRVITHGLPDIVITDMAVNFNDYADKGVLLDLKPYIGDRLLGCVTDVMDFRGHLYTLPTDLQINTFLCLPEVTEDFLTWDVFMDAAASVSGDGVLFSDERAVKYLRENGMMDFFDFADGRAEYDTDRFREVMTFLSDLETRVDTTAGYLTSHSDGTNGYTNTTLPVRLREGGLTFLNLWVRDAEALMMARHLYGEEDFVWCGYPSEHGGGANVNALGRIVVNAETLAKEGCLAFVESLLTPEYQTAETHSNLPVTRDGMRLLFEKNRYWYYDQATYDAIGNPDATMLQPTMSLGGQSVPIVPMSAGLSLDNPDESVYEDTVIVKLEDSDIDAFMHFLDNCHMSAGSDETVEAIVTEELSYWENGVKPLEEVTKIIQSRVGIYLAERK